MFHRIALAGFGLALIGGGAMAAVPPDGALPTGKPALNHASPMINDPVRGKPIRGKAPATPPVQQVVLPDKVKPALNRASPMIDDRLMPQVVKPGAP